MLSWLTVPGRGLRRRGRGRRRRHGVHRCAELDEIAAARPAASARRARVQLKVDTGLSRGGAHRARLAGAGRGARADAEAGRRGRGSPGLVALRLQRRARPPGQRRAGGGVPRGARASPTRAGLEPEVRHLANSAGALILRPCVALRPGPLRASRSTASTRRPAWTPPTLGLVPAMTVARPARAGQAGRRPARASPTGTPGPPSATPRSAWCRSGTATACRGTRRQRAPTCSVGGARRPVARPGLHGPVRRRPRRRRRARPATRSCCSAPATTASRPRRTGPRPAAPSPTRSSPGSAAGSPAGTSTSTTGRSDAMSSAPHGPRAPAAGAAGAGRGRHRGRASRRRAGSSRRRGAGDGADRSASLHCDADHGRRRRRRPAARRGRRARRRTPAARRRARDERR